MSAPSGTPTQIRPGGLVGKRHNEEYKLDTIISFHELDDRVTAAFLDLRRSYPRATEREALLSGNQPQVTAVYIRDLMLKAKRQVVNTLSPEDCQTALKHAEHEQAQDSDASSGLMVADEIQETDLEELTVEAMSLRYLLEGGQRQSLQTELKEHKQDYAPALEQLIQFYNLSDFVMSNYESRLSQYRPRESAKRPPNVLVNAAKSRFWAEERLNALTGLADAAKLFRFQHGVSDDQALLDDPQRVEMVRQFLDGRQSSSLVSTEGPAEAGAQPRELDPIEAAKLERVRQVVSTFNPSSLPDDATQPLESLVSSICQGDTDACSSMLLRKPAPRITLLDKVSDFFGLRADIDEWINSRMDASAKKGKRKEENMTEITQQNRKVVSTEVFRMLAEAFAERANVDDGLTDNDAEGDEDDVIFG